MQIMRSLFARIRKWLGGLLGKKQAKMPHGAGQ